MKQIVTALVIGLFLGLQPLHAEDQKSSSSSIWESLRKKIETLTPKKKLTSTTAVGGVRGALTDPEDVYWKGENVITEIDSSELHDFENALTLVESGNIPEAINAFNNFIDQYPASALVSDATRSVEILKESH